MKLCIMLKSENEGRLSGKCHKENTEPVYPGEALIMNVMENKILNVPYVNQLYLSVVTYCIFYQTSPSPFY